MPGKGRMAASQDGNQSESLGLQPMGSSGENTLFPKVCRSHRTQESLEPAEGGIASRGHGLHHKEALPSHDRCLPYKSSNEKTCQEVAVDCHGVLAEPRPQLSTNTEVTSSGCKLEEYPGSKNSTIDTELDRDIQKVVKDSITQQITEDSCGGGNMEFKVHRLLSSSLNCDVSLPNLPHSLDKCKVHQTTSDQASVSIVRDPKPHITQGTHNFHSSDRGAYTLVPTGIGPTGTQDVRVSQTQLRVPRYNYPPKLSNAKGSLVHVCRCNRHTNVQATQNRPPDYYIYVISALVMCLLCPPFGMTALVFTLRAQCLHRKGLTDKSRISICFAFKWMMAGSAATICMILTATGIQAFLYLHSHYTGSDNNLETSTAQRPPSKAYDGGREMLEKRLLTVLVPRPQPNSQNKVHDEILDKLGESVRSKLSVTPIPLKNIQKTAAGSQVNDKEIKDRGWHSTTQKQHSSQPTAHGHGKDKPGSKTAKAGGATKGASSLPSHKQDRTDDSHKSEEALTSEGALSSHFTYSQFEALSVTGSAAEI